MNQELPHKGYDFYKKQYNELMLEKEQKELQLKTMHVNAPPRGRSKTHSNSPTRILMREYKKNLAQAQTELKELEIKIYKVEGVIEYLSHIQ